MPSWKGKSQGGLLGYKIFVFILKIHGLPLAYFMLRFVASYYLFFSFKTFKSSWHFYRKMLHFSFLKSIGSIYRSYYNLGVSLLDKFASMAGVKTYFTFDFDGEEYLHEMAKAGRGGVLISGHLGNWDMAGNMLKRIETKVNIVLFEGEAAQIKKYMDRFSGAPNYNIISVKQDMSHIFQISAAIQRNEFICIHGDRFTEGTKTFETEFLGQKALFPAGVFQIAHKLKTPYTFVYAIKETSKHYHYSATQPKISTTSPENILKEYVITLEEKAKQYTTQWFNFYNFWQEGRGIKKEVLNGKKPEASS
ncbi:MAG: lipid A biosynthesis acyltransferase [Bacteroidota bacterium]